MNILKSSELIEKGDYQKLYYHLNFESIWLSLFSGITQYRFFNITLNESSISFTPKQDYFHLSNLSNLSKVLNEADQSVLLGMNEPKTFSVKHKKKILCYLHLDWILALQHLKEFDPGNEIIREYLQFETGDSKIAKKIHYMTASANQRSNIYTVNQDSVIINLIDMNASKNTNKLSKANYKLILKNPLISFIEVSRGFDNAKLNICLKWINKLSFKLAEKEKITEDMMFSLKIRKIKRTNKKGMYIANQNTIVVDPRYMDSFVHELGHWYHSHFLPEITTECEAEKFAVAFNDNI